MPDQRSNSSVRSSAPNAGSAAAPPAREAAAAPAPAFSAAPFGLLVLVGSFLLFQVELVMARLLLPAFGSSASVWTTCLMFYQGALFAGYLYAAAASGRIARGGYRWAHVAFVLVPIAFFPFRLWQPDLPPVARILSALMLSAGVPFIALSTTSVICQAWLATTDHPRRSSPYFLYGLSNAGALAALMTYPFVIERRLDLPAQLLLWYAGYGLYALLNVWCVWSLAAASRRVARDSPAPELVRASPLDERLPPIGASARAEWLLLSGGANALLMVVTSVVSTDAPVPLIWILPLTLYLVTLIICFAPTPPSERAVRAWTFGGTAIAIASFVAIARQIRPEIATIALQNAILFVACMMCHDRLIRGRPADPRFLGTFYLSISLGGWLGSVLVGLVAPVAFGWLASHSIDFAFAAALIVAAFVVHDAPRWTAWLRGRPLRIAAATGTAALALAAFGTAIFAGDAADVYGSRTFYGIYHVEDRGGLRRLFHGNTVHGVESLDPGRRSEPLAYYHRDSPIGRYLEKSGGAPAAGIVGLGIGALAAYRQPGQSWDYYEIDPEVEHIARTYFSFLGRGDSAGEPSRVVLGDARLSLEKTPPARYDVLVMDTFSSDFVPLHLITREAVALYIDKLKPGGVLFFHISNRLFDLDPILTRIGSELGLELAVARGVVDPEVSRTTGRFPSIWYAMTGDAALHERLVREFGWSERSRLAGTAQHALWTDSYVDLFDAMK
ncbi:MAG TPA: fused MFS/spermidine synthase [Candidatus Limnocylindrales bacterium]|nr:fused MFS/spermidine synthase [Candidatus Limnocylindrales bacterium]